MTPPPADHRLPRRSHLAVVGWGPEQPSEQQQTDEPLSRRHGTRSGSEATTRLVPGASAWRTST